VKEKKQNTELTRLDTSYNMLYHFFSYIWCSMIFNFEKAHGNRKTITDGQKDFFIALGETTSEHDFRWLNAWSEISVYLQ